MTPCPCGSPVCCQEDPEPSEVTRAEWDPDATPGGRREPLPTADEACADPDCECGK